MTKPRKSRNPAYACGACATPYWQAAEALRCCAPKPVVIPTWVCPECKRMWLDLAEAEECCEVASLAATRAWTDSTTPTTTGGR